MLKFKINPITGKLDYVDEITPGLNFLGSWNASTNTPAISDATGSQGDYYQVSVGGTQNLGSGNIAFSQGDWVIHNGTIFEKYDPPEIAAGLNGEVQINNGGFLGTDSGFTYTSNTLSTENLSISNKLKLSFVDKVFADTGYVMGSEICVSWNTSGGSCTTTLPAFASVSKGTVFKMKHKQGSTGTNTLTVSGNGAETIDGSNTQIIPKGSSMEVIRGTTEWEIN